MPHVEQLHHRAAGDGPGAGSHRRHQHQHRHQHQPPHRRRRSHPAAAGSGSGAAPPARRSPLVCSAPPRSPPPLRRPPFSLGASGKAATGGTGAVTGRVGTSSGPPVGKAPCHPGRRCGGALPGEPRAAQGLGRLRGLLGWAAPADLGPGKGVPVLGVGLGREPRYRPRRRLAAAGASRGGDPGWGRCRAWAAVGGGRLDGRQGACDRGRGLLPWGWEGASFTHPPERPRGCGTSPIWWEKL